jgi:hypothetical protein
MIPLAKHARTHAHPSIFFASSSKQKHKHGKVVVLKGTTAHLTHEAGTFIFGRQPQQHNFDGSACASWAFAIKIYLLFDPSNFSPLIWSPMICSANS